MTEQTQGYNWVLRYLGPSEPKEPTAPVNLYGDIPKQHVLSALRLEFDERLALAKLRGANVWRVCHRWVELAARTLSHAFGDQRVQVPPTTDSGSSRLADDGYTGFWLRILWATVRAQINTGDVHGWALLQRMCALAVEAAAAGVRKPVAWAWTVIKHDGFAEILRDNPSGQTARAAAEGTAGVPPSPVQGRPGVAPSLGHGIPSVASNPRRETSGAAAKPGHEASNVASSPKPRRRK